MEHVLGYQDVSSLFHLVLLLLGFYILFAYQNIFDAIFYGLGKTKYMLVQSVVTNVIYYGMAYLCFSMGLWTPTLSSIALLFGFGIAFDSVVTWIVYRYMMHKMDCDGKRYFDI